MSDPGHHPINESFNELLVLGSWSLVPGSWVLLFFNSLGAHMGVRQGGFQGDVPRAFGTYTPLQLRLKIVLVFDTLFL